MTDPYRKTLPVVRDVTTAVCAWCKWHRRDKDTLRTYDRCSFGTVTELKPVHGWVTYIPNIECIHRNASGDCPHYRPSLFTRLAWWRRLP